MTQTKVVCGPHKLFVLECFWDCRWLLGCIAAREVSIFSLRCVLLGRFSEPYLAPSNWESIRAHASIEEFRRLSDYPVNSELIGVQHSATMNICATGLEYLWLCLSGILTQELLEEENSDFWTF